jgi:CubicO group peptidase (beta-lactamase class C family)
MKKYLLLFALLFSLNLLSMNAQTKKYSADVEEKIKKVENNLSGWVKSGHDDTWTLDERMKKYNINGVSIAVIHNYKIEWARGYGFADVAEKRPVDENTLFQAASISKSLNSVGIMKLAQDKKLDLNTDINKYLETWKFPYDDKSNKKPITITNLLSHTAGLTIHGFPGYAKGAILPTLPQILDGVKPANTMAVRSDNEPGKVVNYSGGGTTISQMIVMDVTHQPYDVFMQKTVLEPLGMSNSSYMQPPAPGKENLLATGYKGDGREVPGKYHIYPEQAAAGLWTNPTDLCKYIIETQLAYIGESAKVLTKDMTILRVTPVLEDAGLGCFVNSRVTGSVKYFNHNGGNEGFSCTSIGSLTGGEGVVIMTNSDNGVLLEEIANSVAIVYNWKDYYLPEEKKEVDVEESVVLKYLGKYNAGGQTITVTMGDNGLVVKPTENIVWRLHFTSDSDFFIREYRGNLKFQSANGKVTGVNMNGQVAPKIDQ